MGSNDNRGFTMIETMLFLAVTALLAVGVLVGSGVAIGQQRYRDSVNSLKSTLQQQYNLVSNTTNNRDNYWTCNSSGVVTEIPAGQTRGRQTRGTSDCVQMGRLVTIQNGTMITTSNVVGYRQGTTIARNDIAELQFYKMTTLTIDQDITTMNWQSVIVTQHQTTPYSLSILILRSPLSGSIVTFIKNTAGVPSDLKTMVSSLNQVARVLCVAAPVGTFVGRQIGVQVDAFAGNQGAVNIPLETDGLCG
ncbi:MAG: prepilin-type N-terminal cleavage/methylation domain-containing protein [Candidatus Saccharimonadales bacterium]